MFIIRVLLAFVLVSLVMGVFGSAFSSWSVQADLKALNVDIPPDLFIETLLHDIKGMGPAFTAVMALAFLIAFSIAGFLLRFVKIAGFLAFGLAGFLGVATSLELMNMLFDTTLVAGARDLTGYLTLSGAGGVAGVLFAWLLRR